MPNTNKSILFIGDYQTSQDKAQGVPFSNASWGELHRLNLRAGIDKDSCVWEYAFSTSPPHEYLKTINQRKTPPSTYFLDFTGSRYPKYKEFMSWVRGETSLPPKRVNPVILEDVKKLFQLVEDFPGNVIVPLGAEVFWILTGNTPVAKWRGSIIPYKGKKLIPCMHPNSLPAHGPSLIKKRLFLADLIRIRKESSSAEFIPTPRVLHTYPTIEQVKAYFAIAMTSDVVGFDIEVLETKDTKEMSCFGISLSSVDGMCIPLVSNRKHYWSLEEEVEIMELLNELLSSEKVRKIGQNLIFDISFVFRKYGILTRNFDDSMIAMAIRFPDLPKALDFLTRHYTSDPFYKDEGKIWNNFDKDVNVEKTFFEYNAKDSCYVMEIFPKIHTQLVRQSEFVQSKVRV